MLLEGGTYYLFAGDSIVNLERADRERDSGIAVEPDAARHTHELIRKQLRDFDTILAPAHDKGAQTGARFPNHTH